jgi:RNA polymerase subunit RPABC4/transcription elongation factor Spt4
VLVNYQTKITKEEFKMIEFIVTIVNCIILIILNILFVKQAIFFFSNEEKFAGGMCIYLSVLTLFFSFYGGYKYYISQKQDFCPNCHYEYKTNEKFDYCPECNAKLTNKCDSCNKYLPDSATDTCPYCGKEIEVKIGEIPPGNN